MITSCQVEDLRSFSKDKGTITLDLSAVTDFGVGTKAVNEADYKAVNNYKVQILKSGEATPIEEFLYKDKPTSVELENGSYTIKAFYGTDAVSSRDAFYVEGSTTFNVQGDEQPLSFTCEPVCGKVVVAFDASMATYYSDYSVKYSSTTLGNSTVIWAKDDTEPWYLKLASGGETVTATISLTAKSEYQTGKTAELVRTYKLERNKAWTLQIAPSYNSSEGTLGISIKVDESTNDHEIDVVIPSEWI